METGWWLIVSCFGFAAFTLILGKARHQRRVAEENAKQAPKVLADRKRALDARTHVERDDGSIATKCAVELCNWPAVRRTHRYERDEGVLDLLRRKFRALARWSVVEDTWAIEKHCETHAASARELLQKKLLEQNSRVNQTVIEAELALGHYERVGLDAELDELERNQELADPHRMRRQAAKAKVLPFRR